MSSVFYMTAQGKYEIHLTLKASKGHIVAMKELASEVGKMAGRIMVPGRGERPIIGDEYCTVACVEGARFHTIQGVAKIGKGSEKNFRRYIFDLGLAGRKKRCGTVRRYGFR